MGLRGLGASERLESIDELNACLLFAYKNPQKQKIINPECTLVSDKEGHFLLLGVRKQIGVILRSSFDLGSLVYLYPRSLFWPP